MGAVDGPWPVGEFGGVVGLVGFGARLGAVEVLSRTPPMPWPYSRLWLWWYMAAEIPLSCRRRTRPREVLVVRVASLHKTQGTLRIGIGILCSSSREVYIVLQLNLEKQRTRKQKKTERK